MKRMQINMAAVCAVAAIGAMLSGCVALSPLVSQDPAVRKQAMEQVTDQKELFFIAMNIDAGFFPSAHLSGGEYPEDVRVMAVNKLADPGYLLRCAFWNDGDLYEDEGADINELAFRGKTYRAEGNWWNLRTAVAPGDAVRAAAREKICELEMLKKVAAVVGGINAFGNGGQGGGRRGVSSGPSAGASSGGSGYVGILPRGFMTKDRRFIEYANGDSAYFDRQYAPVRPGNPLDVTLTEIVEKQDLRGAVAFLFNASSSGPTVAPKAYAKAFSKLSKINSKTASALFRKVCMNGDKLRDDIREENKASFEEWKSMLFSRIENPDDSVLNAYLSGMNGCGGDDLAALFAKIKDKKVLCQVAQKMLGDKYMICGKYVESFSNDKLVRFRTSSGTLYEIKPDAARNLLKALNDEDTLAHLALTAGLFSIRKAAAEKIKNTEMLFTIATDKLENCPIDTSLKEYDYDSNWSSITYKKSRANLRKAAIEGVSDVAVLKKIRSQAGDQLTKQYVSNRMAALGANDLDELLAYDKYDADLFTYLESTKDEGVLQKLAQGAKLKGVRLMAARALGEKTYAEIAAKEVPDGIENVPDGVVHVGAFRLDMSIEDALALFATLDPESNPKLYLDKKVLCIANKGDWDLAWADAKSLKVHWFTLRTPFVKKLVGFQSGSFDDLERVVRKNYLGDGGNVNFITKNSVKQEIWEIANTDGITMRYFRKPVSFGEDTARSLRKFRNSYQDNGGSASGLANAMEDALQGAQNNDDAQTTRFAPQGSIQILYTRDAVKGIW